MSVSTIKRPVQLIENGQEVAFAFEHENVKAGTTNIRFYYVAGPSGTSRHITWGKTRCVPAPAPSKFVTFYGTPTFQPQPEGMNPADTSGGDGTVTIVFTNPPDSPGGLTTNTSTPAVPIMYT